jgi:pilus assembly protein CpaF
MLSRLETMVLSGSTIPLDAVRQQMASAIDIMIHLSRFRDKTRKVVEITEVLDYMNGHIRLNPLYTFMESGGTEDGTVLGKLIRTKNAMKNLSKFKMAGISGEI